MKNFIGPASALSMAVALMLAQSTPSFGDVFVNNVLSPFTTIQVGPGYAHVYRYDHYGYGAPRYQHYRERSYYERPHHYRSRYGRGYGRHAYCWVVTDSHRGYGYWGWCR